VERLAGKRCLVTAAGQGIGRAIALGFAAEGADVLATDIGGAARAALGEVRDDIGTSGMDATDAERSAAVCNSRTFDAVANVVGYVHQGSILDCAPEDWERTFRVNVDSAYLVCKAVLPAMLANGGGSIINLSSVASSIKGVPARFAYGAAKGAVIGLSKAVAAAFVGQGVRCNAICPGNVDTPALAERVAELGGDAGEVWLSFMARQPMGRLGRAEEVAHLAVYLASDESAFTTGCEFVIDGGWSI